MTLRILIVEDDEKIGSGLVEVYSRAGYEAVWSRTGEDGFFRWTTEHYDLVVLDLGLPGRDGMEVLAALRRANRGCLVMILSSRDDVQDRVRGLELGADDYLVKPFAVSELLARTQALVRRGRSDTLLKLQVRDLCIDLLTRRVERSSKRIELTTREFEMLEYLARHAGHTVSREMLARDVWRDVERATPLDNVIDVHIARLRRKVDLPGLERLIQTVRGIGFRLGEGGSE